MGPHGPQPGPGVTKGLIENMVYLCLKMFWNIFGVFGQVLRFLIKITWFLSFSMQSHAQSSRNFVTNFILDPKRVKFDQKSNIWAYMGPYGPGQGPWRAGKVEEKRILKQNMLSGGHNRRFLRKMWYVKNNRFPNWVSDEFLDDSAWFCVEKLRKHSFETKIQTNNQTYKTILERRKEITFIIRCL